MGESDPDEEHDTDEIKMAVHHIDRIDGSNSSPEKDENNDDFDSQENIIQMGLQYDISVTEVQDSCQQTDGNGDSLNSESDNCEEKGEYFILSTIDEVKDMLNEYFERTSSNFVINKRTKDFGLPGALTDLSGHRIQWHDIQMGQMGCERVIKFDGTPHLIVGHWMLDCQFGTDGSTLQKQKRKKMKEDGKLNVASRNMKTPSKKCGCPARIMVREVVRFPQFKLQMDTKRRRSDVSAVLKDLLKTPKKLKMEILFVGRLADITEHKYHNLIQEGYSKEVVHRDLIIMAQELDLKNLDLNEIMESLNNHVRNELFWNKEPPDPRRRRYYPTKKDVMNFIRRLRTLNRFTSEEEEKVRNIVDEINGDHQKGKVLFSVDEANMSDDIIDQDAKPDSPYDDFFEPDPNEKDKGKEKRKKERIVQTFLFCYQSPKQKRLMKMYSNITYLTELDHGVVLKNALLYRFYIMFVQTNVDYQVVGSIVVSKQRKNGLVEGLKVFQEWNSYWNPKHMFVDCSEVMFDAVAQVFPDAGEYLNLHSCESKWMEFTSTRSNEVEEHTDEIIGYMRGMQYSLTEEALSNAAVIFEESEIWKSNEKLRHWFQGKWLHLAKYWVFGYRPEDLVVMHHLNLTADDCINVYREAFSCSLKRDGLMDLLFRLTNIIPSQEYDKYVQRNNENYEYYHRYAKSCVISCGLQGVPKSILPYVHHMYHLVHHSNLDIQEDTPGTFNVICNSSEKISSCHGDKEVTGSRSNNEDNCSKEIGSFVTDFSTIRYLNESEGGNYSVSFGGESLHPFCTCSYWNTYKLPCVHMTAVFSKIPGWTFHELSPLYRYNPIIDIDYSTLVRKSLQTSKNDVECQTTFDNNTSVGTQTSPSLNIFESSQVPVTDSLLQQAKGLLDYIRNTAILFKDKIFHSKLLEELQTLVVKIKMELVNKVKLMKSLDIYNIQEEDILNVKQLIGAHKHPLLAIQYESGVSKESTAKQNSNGNLKYNYSSTTNLTIHPKTSVTKENSVTNSGKIFTAQKFSRSTTPSNASSISLLRGYPKMSSTKVNSTFTPSVLTKSASNSSACSILSTSVCVTPIDVSPLNSITSTVRNNATNVYVPVSIKVKATTSTTTSAEQEILQNKEVGLSSDADSISCSLEKAKDFIIPKKMLENRVTDPKEQNEQTSQISEKRPYSSILSTILSSNGDIIKRSKVSSDSHTKENYESDQPIEIEKSIGEGYVAHSNPTLPTGATSLGQLKRESGILNTDLKEHAEEKNVDNDSVSSKGTEEKQIDFKVMKGTVSTLTLENNENSKSKSNTISLQTRLDISTEDSSVQVKDLLTDEDIKEGCG